MVISYSSHRTLIQDLNVLSRKPPPAWLSASVSPHKALPSHSRESLGSCECTGIRPAAHVAPFWNPHGSPLPASRWRRPHLCCCYGCPSQCLSTPSSLVRHARCWCWLFILSLSVTWTWKQHCSFPSHIKTFVSRTPCCSTLWPAPTFLCGQAGWGEVSSYYFLLFF